jgi:predicted secreted protein
LRNSFTLKDITAASIATFATLAVCKPFSSRALDSQNNKVSLYAVGLNPNLYRKMNKKLRFGLLLLLILGLQTVIGVVFIKSYIFTWGATDQEVSMSMPGDHLAPFISSTRAITINAPISDVWDWVIQLGADRGGFYSYWFIERPLGYNFRETNRVEAKFKDMEVGRIIKASLDPSKSFIEYNFPVVFVDPGKSFVLENWGCFLLNEVDSTRTRLLVRTHGRSLVNLTDYLDYFFMMPLHYLMERRMLIGIKSRSEAGPGEPFSSTNDILWFLGVLLSFCGIVALLLNSKTIQSESVVVIYSMIWLLVLFVADPIPIYSMALLLALVINILYLKKSKIGKRHAY